MGETDSEPEIPSRVYSECVDTPSSSSRKRSQDFDNSRAAKRFNGQNKENRLSHSSINQTPRTRSREKVTPSMTARTLKSGGSTSGSRGFYGKKAVMSKQIIADQTPNRIHGRRAAFFSLDHGESREDESREDESREDVDGDQTQDVRDQTSDDASDSEDLIHGDEVHDDVSDCENQEMHDQVCEDGFLGNIHSPSPATSEMMPAAFKEITNLIRTVVQRMDRMENELKRHISSLSSGSASDVRKATKSKTSIPLIVKASDR